MAYYQYPKGVLSNILRIATTKAGSERNLSRITGIPASSLYHLKKEHRLLSEKYLVALQEFLHTNLKVQACSSFPDSWRQTLGGKKLIEKKKQDGTFQDTILRLKVSSANRMRLWHKLMREQYPEEYSKIQYERLKTIRGYKEILHNGTPVRNSLEKEVGNYLIAKKYLWAYEAAITNGKTTYFPDFCVNDVIIEVTAWKHPSKSKLRRLCSKYHKYRELGFRACFFIPESYRKFYKKLPGPIFSNLEELGVFITPL